MASVVFLRGVNVGGRKTFRPAALARELSDLDVASVGAAGTFVVRARVSQAVIRKEILGRLPFEPGVVVCRGKEILDLVAAEPFPRRRVPGSKRYVSVLEKKPRKLPGFPCDRPEGEPWQVRLLGVEGRFVLSLHRRRGRKLLYPNQVVEKVLGVGATSRNWDTMLKVRGVLDG